MSIPTGPVVLAPGAQPAGDLCLVAPDRGARIDDRQAIGYYLDSAARRLALARDLGPVWIASLLEHLDRSRGYLALGRSSLHDYAREELGLAPWAVRQAIRFGRGMVAFPSLHAAMLAGRLSVNEARQALPVLRSDQDVEPWVACRTGITHREWRERIAATQAAEAERHGMAHEPDADDAPRERFSFSLEPWLLVRWRTARELVSRIEGYPVPPEQVLDSVLGEWHARTGGVGTGEPPLATSSDAAGSVQETSCADSGTGPEQERARFRRLQIDLEEETKGWRFLEWARPELLLSPGVEAVVRGSEPDGLQAETRPDPHELHARLLYLTRLQNGLDRQMGRVLHTIRRFKLTRDMFFASFGHYAEERLGMSRRQAYYLSELDARLWRNTPFLEAFEHGEISWYQAWLLARLPPDTLASSAWLARAKSITVARLAEELDWVLTLREVGGKVAAQAGGLPPLDPEAPDEESRHDEVRVNSRIVPSHWRAVSRDEALIAAAPGRVQITFALGRHQARALRAALREVRAVAQDPTLTDDDCFGVLLESFIQGWEHAEADALRHQWRIFNRDGWRCRMPGCTRRGPLHAHHIVHRSRGGSDHASNLISLCWTCHERVVHGGYGRVSGQAPDALEFEIGTRTGQPPLGAWRGERRRERCRPRREVAA